MAKDERKSSEKGLSKRIATLERKVGELTRKTPIPADQAANMAAREAEAGERPDFLRVRPGNANFSEAVGRDVERLQGRSRSGTTPDDRRGAVSQLGHGEIAEREQRRKR